LILSASPEGNRVIAIFAAKPEEPHSLPRAFYLFSIGICLSVLVALWIVVPGEILHYNLRAPSQVVQFRRLITEAVLLFFGASALVIFIRRMTAGHRWRRGEGNPGLASRGYLRSNAVSAVLAIAGFGAIAAACSIALAQSAHWNQPSPILPLFWVFFCFGCFAVGATAAASVVPLWDAGHSKNRFDVRAKAGGIKRVLLLPYFWATLLVSGIGVVLIGYACKTVFARGQDGDVHFLAACRSLDLTSNVSPLLPVTMLMISLTALAFVQLRRVTYHEDRCPRVPNLHGDPFCPKLGSIVNEIRKRIRTFSFHPVHLAAFPVFLVFLFCAVVNRGQQTLENRWLEALIMSLSLATGLFIVLIWIRVLLVWSAFSEFLQQLERHPLRHVFSLLPRGFVWSPVWQGGGKRRIHVAVTRSLECILALRDRVITDPTLQAAVYHPKVKRLEEDVTRLLRVSASRRRVTSMFYRRLEKELSAIAGDAARYLEKTKWPKGNYELKAELSKREETKDALRTSAPEYKEHEPETICGELVAFRFLAFINYVLLQLHTLVGYTSLGFILLVIALNCYEFRARTIIDWLLILMFAFVSAGIVAVFAQADRDPILSRITGTEAGKLDRHFFTHLISYGALPSLALAATHFPTIGRFFFSWVKPALESIH
jgi:ABC-type multidrug transport system fused ATPase/permease subunit